MNCRILSTSIKNVNISKDNLEINLSCIEMRAKYKIYAENFNSALQSLFARMLSQF